jgi:hypothetical protein
VLTIDGVPSILIFATPETFANLVSETDTKPNNWIGIVVSGTVPRAYTQEELMMTYSVERAEYGNDESAMLTLTCLGDEEITGTFSSGEFKVKRIPDESWNPFDGGGDGQ